MSRDRPGRSSGTHRAVSGSRRGDVASGRRPAGAPASDERVPAIPDVSGGVGVAQGRRDGAPDRGRRQPCPRGTGSRDPDGFRDEPDGGGVVTTGIDQERLHAASLITPPRETRTDRRARTAARTGLVQASAQGRRDMRRAEAAELAAEQRARQVLPQAGQAGPAALRTPGRFKVRRHQDTSATLAGAYPFLAEGGLGSDGVFVGQDLYSGSSFVYDPWVLYQRGFITAPNLVLAGIVGSGKSSLAKSLYTRSIGFG